MAEASVHWKEGMAFEASLNGHTFIIDTTPAGGGKDLGPSPKPLLLVALAGCTAMDVISLLQKMRVDFKDLQVHVNGDMTDEHPKVYKSLHVVYEIIGGNPEHDKVEKAVHLSEEKYCGVSAMLKKAFPITWEIRYSNG